jgi:hypothetical protein
VPSAATAGHTTRHRLPDRSAIADPPGCPPSRPCAFPSPCLVEATRIAAGQNDRERPQIATPTRRHRPFRPIRTLVCRRPLPTAGRHRTAGSFAARRLCNRRPPRADRIRCVTTRRRRRVASQPSYRRLGKCGQVAGHVNRLQAIQESSHEHALMLVRQTSGSVCYGGDREAPGPGALCLDHLHNWHYAEPEGLE